jgi:PAS domain S-box-containing protein
VVIVTIETTFERLRRLERLPRIARYALTVLIVLAFFLLRRSLGESLQGYPFLLFFPAIIICAAAFDRGSGLLAVGLSTILAVTFFVGPEAERDPAVNHSLVLALYIGVATFTAISVEALRSLSERLRRTRDELTNTQALLQKQVSLLNSITEGLPEPIFVKDESGLYVHVNAAFVHEFGGPREYIIGTSDANLLGGVEAEHLEALRKSVVATKAPRVFEAQLTSAHDPRLRTYLFTKAPWFSENGRVVGVVGIIRDIQQRKEMEQELRTAGELNRLLLFDINHRVKNHLQALGALLLQAKRDVGDAKAQEVLTEVAGRLGVLARVYDRLHLDGGSTSVQAREFIEALCLDLESGIVGTRPVVIRTHVDATIELDSQRAVAVGLIINELVTNALKHAFPEERSGVITVDLHRQEDGYCLEVSDDGIGTDEEALGKGSGGKIIRMFTQQLGGKLLRQGPPGTTVRLCFNRGTD